MILKSLLALLALVGAAHAETLTLNYQLSAAGLGAADVQVIAKLETSSYEITATGQTYGAADFFGSLTLSALSKGDMADQGPQPLFFGTSNIYDGDARLTRVSWSGREAKTTQIVPTLEAEDRTAIPDDARMDALDPIAALMRFSYGEPARGRCAGSVKVFDGRRSYTLSLDNADGGGAWEKRDIGNQETTLLRCNIISVRTGGKSPGSLFSRSKAEENGTIWFWRDPKGRAIPVRVEADAPIGTGVAELAALPVS